jgi:hypothetical protein
VWDFHYLMGNCFVAKLLVMIKYGFLKVT